MTTEQLALDLPAFVGRSRDHITFAVNPFGAADAALVSLGEVLQPVTFVDQYGATVIDRAGARRLATELMRWADRA